MLLQYASKKTEESGAGVKLRSVIIVKNEWGERNEALAAVREITSMMVIF